METVDEDDERGPFNDISSQLPSREQQIRAGTFVGAKTTVAKEDHKKMSANWALERSNPASSGMLIAEDNREEIRRLLTTTLEDNVDIDEALEQDPFLQYGVGVKNFFELHRKMLWMFAFLSLIALVQMVVYLSFGGLSYMKGEALHFFTKISFGNIGFASTICGKNIISLEPTTNLFF